MQLLKERYNLPILISENGLGDFDHVVRNEDGTVEVLDNNRIKYIQDHIREISKAIDAGVDVLAYCT
jgi:6-phospho-beta-glucosidase